MYLTVAIFQKVRAIECPDGYLSFRRTSGALTTTPARTPKPPSEIVGKTVEEVILSPSEMHSRRLGSLGITSNVFILS